MAYTTSDIPFGPQFSPNQVDLPVLLELAIQKGGDRRGFEKAIRTRYFEKRSASAYNKNKLANNAALGMIAYGIIDRQASLTDLGEQLYKAKGDPQTLYGLLGRHILLKLRGLDLVQTAEDMRAHGERFALGTFRARLAERGIRVPRGAVHMSSMRLWLEKAGVVISQDWRVDYARLEELVGATQTEIDMLATLTKEQKAYMKALANTGTPGPHRSNEIEKMASLLYGIKFDEKNLPKQVLYPLEAAGYVKLARGTKAPGRGAKPFLITVTDKFHSEILRPLLEALEKQTAADIRPLLRKSFAEILSDIRSPNRHVKGLALEALAFHLMRLLDLSYVATRLRGVETGGAEVDLVFEGIRFIFSRWQIQCKNTGMVRLDDVAKEVGLTFQLKANVVMVVSTGTIGSEARNYASHVMRTTNLDLILVDKEDLERIRTNPTWIAMVLEREARNAMQIKKLELR
jgi:hypothetical protein